MPQSVNTFSNPPGNASSAFHDGFTHGLSAVLGAVFGLCVWVSFQPAPIILDYHFVLNLDEKNAPTAPAKPPPVKTPPPVAPTPALTPTPAPVASPVPPAAPLLTPDDSAPFDGGKTASGPHAAVPVSVEDMLPHAAPETPATTVKNPSAEIPPSASAPARAKISIPLPDLVVDTPPYGMIPTVNPTTHATPFSAYRVPVAPATLNKPLIAVVVMDFGLSEKSVAATLGTLPPGTSVVVSPAARDPKITAQRAYDAGFEIWSELSVEPPDYPASDPGRDGILTHASVDQNRTAMMRQLAHIPGAVGFFARYGASPVLTDGPTQADIARSIFSRGLGLVINAIPRKDDAFLPPATQEKAPYYTGTMVMLDTPALSPLVFQTIEAQAQADGYAILLIAPTPGVRAAVATWAARVAKTGDFALAPLSVIAERGLHLMKD